MVAASASGPMVPCVGWLALLNSTSLMSGFPSRWIWSNVCGVLGPLSSLHPAAPRPSTATAAPSVMRRKRCVRVVRNMSISMVSAMVCVSG